MLDSNGPLIPLHEHDSHYSRIGFQGIVALDLDGVPELHDDGVVNNPLLTLRNTCAAIRERCCTPMTKANLSFEHTRGVAPKPQRHRVRMGFDENSLNRLGISPVLSMPLQRSVQRRVYDDPTRIRFVRQRFDFEARSK